MAMAYYSHHNPVFHSSPDPPEISMQDHQQPFLDPPYQGGGDTVISNAEFLMQSSACGGLVIV